MQGRRDSARNVAASSTQRMQRSPVLPVDEYQLVAVGGGGMLFRRGLRWRSVGMGWMERTFRHESGRGDHAILHFKRRVALVALMTEYDLGWGGTFRGHE